MRLAVIGIGLMGGSLALSLKKKGFVHHVIGVDPNEHHQEQALALGIVDEIMTLDKAIESADLIAITTPVNIAEQLLPMVLNQVNQQVVFDLGSTKESIVHIANAHSKKGRFVPTHPMWGTEFSGPAAAQSDAFVEKATVICNKEQVDQDALELVEKLYQQLGMHILYMNAIEHDIHVAYVSHISHITSFALANTVLEKEKESEEEKENYKRREFSYSGFSRSFQLPENSLPEKIEAKYENGILRLSLPKKERTSVKHRREIKVA